MAANRPSTDSPRSVFISSSFSDLKDLRDILIKRISEQGMKPVAVEHVPPDSSGGVLNSLLRLIRNSGAYIGIIGSRYGFIPEDPYQNPYDLSVTELEFNEARQLKLPMLVFAVGELASEKFENDPHKLTLLRRFTERAASLRSNSDQFYRFNHVPAPDFDAAATVGLRDLRDYLDQQLIASQTHSDDIDRGSAGADGDDSPASPHFESKSVDEPPSRAERVKPLVFISASHSDSKWRTFLEQRLDQYKEDIEWWDDSKLETGMTWEDEIDSARSRAKVAVLLLSEDYLNSRNAIAEMAILSARAKSKGGLQLFPIVVHNCEWQDVPEIRSLEIWNKGRALDEISDRKSLSLQLQGIAGKILKLVGKEPAAPSPPIDSVDLEKFTTTTDVSGFSSDAQLIVDKAKSLARETGRNRVTSSCLLFAFAESEVSRNNPVVRAMLETGQYSNAFKRFLTDSDTGTSNAVETSIGLVSKYLTSVIGYAEKVAFLVSSAKTIHQRHLLAALLNPPGLKGKLGAHKRLKEMGLARSRYLGDLLAFILSSEPDDDDIQWKSVLAVGAPPKPKLISSSFQEGPAGYTAEFVGVGGERAVDDYLFVGTHANRLAELIALRETKLPLAIGLFGNWGSGKSHFMNLIDRRLKGLMEVEKKRAANASPKWCREIVPIYFNAWHYLDANLWASLVAQIFESLFAHLSPRGKDLEQVQAMLEQASGATARAAEELAIAESATKQAQKDLTTARETRVNAETFVDGVLRGLQSLLPETRPEEVQNKAAELLGIEKEVKTIDDLRQLAAEAESLSARTQGVFKNLWKQPGRGWRIAWLLTVVGGGGLITAIVVWYLPVLKIRLAPTGQAIATVLGAISAFGLWLRPLLAAAGRRLNQVEDWTSQAEREQQRLRETERVKQAAQTIAVAAAKEDAAKLQLAEAQARESQLKEEAESLSPGRRLGRYIEQRAQSADYRGQLGLVSLARRDFQELSNLFDEAESKDRIAELRKSDMKEKRDEADKIEELSKSIDRIVLFVDDLDRCQPEKIVEILQAVHLLLAFPLFAVVVGVDQRALRQSLRMQFKGLLTPDSQSDGLKIDVNERTATPLDYLEKIFHVPFHLPAMGQEGFAELISKLTEPTKGEPPKAQSEDAPRQVSVVQETAEKPEAKPTPTPLTSHANTYSEPIKVQQLPSVEQIQPEKAGAELVERVAAEMVGSVPLSDWERKALREYHALIQTPRAAKRLLNTYRLVRAGIPKEEWADFSAGEYRIAMLLLAAAAGYPATAREWFSKLSTSNPEKVLEDKSFVSLDPAAWTQFKNVHKATFTNGIPKLASENTTKWIRRVEAFTF